MRDDTAITTLHTAVRRILEATNAEDREGFLAAFTPDAVVDDFGRRFTGHDQIAAWSDTENIGTHNRITVTDARPQDRGVVLDIDVRGDGYNGTGTFTITTRDDLINSMVIRG